MSVFSLVFLIVFFAFIAKSDEKSPDFSTIQTLFDLDVKCFQEIDEKFCHKKYLNSFDGIPPEIGANQESEKYKQLVCCNTWRYFDCVSDDVSKTCLSSDVTRLSVFTSEVNEVTIYCLDYPYESYRCWRFPLWAVVVCVLVAIALIIGAAFGVWFWRRKQRITYWRRRRKY
ncbi:unnamed protein product [Oppiella nova]|uniref:Uncharacterized protein n=1 Tax=Oppiella nova TaxID=334625 RepID=A0A7R9QSA8_9ACAR|nr:unnamed protein product [Oppiella nova]CAG2173853.1 unnamed protein product [Oppiella nova]